MELSFPLRQMSDILYYEVLDIPLPELQGLKTLKVAFHNASKDEVSWRSIVLVACRFSIVLAITNPESCRWLFIQLDFQSRVLSEMC